jgi:hypothetical protein
MVKQVESVWFPILLVELAVHSFINFFLISSFLRELDLAKYPCLVEPINVMYVVLL